MLLVGAGLFVRTLANLSSINPGFDARQVLVFTLNGSRSGYKADALASLYERIRARMELIPGVQAATLSSVPLIADSEDSSEITVSGYTAKAGSPAQTYDMSVGRRFFTTMGLPILLGRALSERDAKDAPLVAVVNQTFARKYLSGQNPLGSKFYFGTKPHAEPKDMVEVVGVCQDAHYDSLKHAVPPTAYLPAAQTASWLGRATYELRTPLSTASLAGAVRQAVAGIDRNLPVADMRTQEQQIDMSLGMERLFAGLVGSFGATAMLLAAIGLYGIIAYTVTRRTAEIGIRLALGAPVGRVQWMVLRESVLMVVVGMSLGIPAALALTRLVRSSLFGVEPSDPLSFLAAGTLMLAVAVAAAWIPARRASRIDALRALRYE